MQKKYVKRLITNISICFRTYFDGI